MSDWRDLVLSGGTVDLGILQRRRFSRPMGDLAPLKRSMNARGVDVPILVTPTYEVVDGERRVAVARQLGWRAIPCLATSDFDTMCKHLLAARLAGEDGLPFEPMLLTNMVNLMDLLGEFNQVRVNILRRRPRSKGPLSNPTRATGRSEFHEKVSEALGQPSVTFSRVRTTRHIIDEELAKRTTLGEEMDKYFQEWERGRHPEISITQLYDNARRHTGRTRDGGSAVAEHWVPIGTRTRPSLKDMGAWTKPTTVTQVTADRYVLSQPDKDSKRLGATQTSAIQQGLAAIRGGVDGLLAIAPLSSHLSNEDLKLWMEQVRQISLLVARVKGIYRIALEHRETREEQHP
jgi:hypothetical protein